MDHGTCAAQGFIVPAVTSIEQLSYLMGPCCARADGTL